MSVCLTNATDIEDGLGAQLQRRLEIYLLSNYLGINFHFHEIKNFDSNYGDGMNTEKDRKKVLKQCRDLLPFLYVSSNIDEFYEFEFLNNFIRKLKWRNICKSLKIINLFSNFLHVNLLIRFSFPHKMDLNRELLLRKIPKSKPKIGVNRKISIIMHIPWARASLLPDRKMPIEWYTETLQTIVQFLESRRLKYNIVIHTDSSPNLDSAEKQNWISDITTNYWKSTGNEKFLNGYGYAFIDMQKIFSNFRNSKIVVNVDPIQVWEDFAKSDILIVSNSSFSFIGAIVAKHRILGFIPDRNPSPISDIVPLAISGNNVNLIFQALELKLAQLYM